MERGHQLTSGPGCRLDRGYHQPVCIETVVAPLHHFLVEGCGRQQQPYGGNVLEYGSCYGFVCYKDCFLCFPHVVDVSVLIICIVLHAFVVILGSRVSPSIFGLMFMGNVMLSICTL